MPIVTLLTDFGTQDEYVGVLKGVIYSINPSATIVDISHCISPQNVVQAAYVLHSAFPYFPHNTIHLAVIDPGVGSNRAIIAARQDGQTVVAPDNGVCSLLWDKNPPDYIVKVENPVYFRQPVSRTFHGRDIMAPVAAYLSAGLNLKEVGPLFNSDQVVKLPISRPAKTCDNVIHGLIVYQDRFGNLVTNIGLRHLDQIGIAGSGSGIKLTAGHVSIQGMAPSYSHAEPGHALLIIGSRNCLEIAVNQGNAAKVLGIGPGTACQVSCCTFSH